MISNFLFKRPIVVVFDVTKRCNSKCNMCSLWKRPSKVSDELTIKQVEKIFTDLKSFGIKQVFIQGGEPFLRDDLFEIISLIDSIGLKPCLITNGLLLTKFNALALSKLNCNVTVSLDTLKPLCYKKIRGIDAFNVVKKNLLFASKLPRKGYWSINSTISELNADELVSLYDFAIVNGFSFSSFA